MQMLHGQHLTPNNLIPIAALPIGESGMEGYPGSPGYPSMPLSLSGVRLE